MPAKTETCTICFDSYTLQQRKKITCSHCQYAACRACLKRCLTNSTQDAHCPECRVAWNNDFLIDNFLKSWYRHDYMEHRSRVIFRQEEARMSETVEMISLLKNVLQLREAASNVMSERRNTFYDLMQLKDDIESKKPYTENLDVDTIEEKYKLAKSSLETARQRYNMVAQVYRNAEYLVWGNAPQNLDGVRQFLETGANDELDSENQHARAKFTMPCPVDQCKGLLSQRYKCAICETSVCSKCHEVKKTTGAESEHACDPDVVKSVALIKQEAKPCPSCSTMIVRIHGCDQMWCTQCHIAFSWETGQFEHGTIHNPHYFEYIQEHENFGNVMLEAYGGQIDAYAIRSMVQRVYGDDSKYMHLFTAVRTVYHTEGDIVQGFERAMRPSRPQLYQLSLTKEHYALLPEWYRYINQSWLPRVEIPEDDPHKLLRMFYALGALSKEQFHQQLKTYEVKRAKNTVWVQIYRMFVDMAKEILFKLEQQLAELQMTMSVDEGKTVRARECIAVAYDDFRKLVQYVNTKLYRYIVYYKTKKRYAFFTTSFGYSYIDSSYFEDAN